MKKSLNVLLSVLLLALLTLACWPANAQTDEDALAVVRSVIQADRQAVVANTMQLSETESPAFWPLYRQYRAEMDKVADGLVKLMQEYAAAYPDVPDDRAKKILQQMNDLQKKHVATRATYLKKFGKVLPPSKNLRFAQVENRLDLVLQLKLASIIPLVPIEGPLTGETTGAAVLAQGVPGGTVVQTYELAATVAAINPVNRKVTLVDSSGFKTTVKAGPEVINFDQIRVGDQLKLTLTEKLVVYVADADEAPTDTGIRFVALAPEGAKPGGILADTVQVTAEIIALDAERRKATLQFEDGTTSTVAVRQDVDLSKRKIGDKVVIRATESLAIKIQKP